MAIHSPGRHSCDDTSQPASQPRSRHQIKTEAAVYVIYIIVSSFHSSLLSFSFLSSFIYHHPQTTPQKSSLTINPKNPHHTTHVVCPPLASPHRTPLPHQKSRGRTAMKPASAASVTSALRAWCSPTISCSSAMSRALT